MRIDREKLKASYWHSNEEWYRFNYDKQEFELTDKAPKEAQESFELYLSIKRN